MEFNGPARIDIDRVPPPMKSRPGPVAADMNRPAEEERSRDPYTGVPEPQPGTRGPPPRIINPARVINRNIHDPGTHRLDHNIPVLDNNPLLGGRPQVPGIICPLAKSLDGIHDLVPLPEKRIAERHCLVHMPGHRSEYIGIPA